ncbi:P-loop containing nucleoside triphosphate hydrolase protein, partial [Blyttiomyces helicus]
PTARLSDLGGTEHCIEEVLQLIGMPLKHPEIYVHLGIQPPRGILLHGPPGCGKTLLAHAIAGEVGVPFIKISAPSVVSGMSGESEKKIREVFEEARDLAPCLLFIDEIDAITPKRETAQREMERRIVAQLLTCMDDLTLENTGGKPVLIIGATNRPDSLDAALRRAGRFDREISMGVPDERGRGKILEKLSSKLRLSGDFDFQKLAKMTPGYVGADLNALTSEAGMIAVQRIFQSLQARASVVNPEPTFEKSTADESAMDIDEHEQPAPPIDLPTPSAPEPSTSLPSEALISAHLTNALTITSFLESRPNPLTPAELSDLCITHADFILALKKVQPSSKREGFATVPGVSWSDIGALTHVREELRMAVVEPIRHPERFSRMGISAPMGVLLYGPPGCGKTLLAKAVANESHCNFISVKGPELLNKYVGESERAVRMVFARAQASRPCVIFFDELDALCPARSNDAESQSSSRLVNTLLTEMDGMQGRNQVYVIAATNRPDMIDPAMLRPGRLDKTLYIDLPNAEERYEILRTLSRVTPMASDVDLGAIARDLRCDGYSGAD